MTKINDFIDYFKNLKNPISCLLFKFGFKKSIVVKPRNTNKTVELKFIKDINLLMTILSSFNDDLYNIDDFIEIFDSYVCDKKTINWNGINIPNYHKDKLPLTFFELYTKGYYNSFGIDYNNRSIIDIGSNGGDSSLYFVGGGGRSLWI